MIKKTIQVLLVLIFSFSLITPIFAAGLSASPPSFQINLNPSQSFTGTVNIANIGQNPLQINITGQREQSDGRNLLFSDNGIASWISTHNKQFKICLSRGHEGKNQC